MTIPSRTTPPQTSLPPRKSLSTSDIPVPVPFLVQRLAAAQQPAQQQQEQQQSFVSEEERSTLSAGQLEFLERKRRAAAGLGPIMPDSCTCQRCGGSGTAACHQCGGTGTNGSDKAQELFQNERNEIVQRNGLSDNRWFFVGRLLHCWAAGVSLHQVERCLSRPPLTRPPAAPSPALQRGHRAGCAAGRKPLAAPTAEAAACVAWQISPPIKWACQQPGAVALAIFL